MSSISSDIIGLTKKKYGFLPTHEHHSTKFLLLRIFIMKVKEINGFKNHEYLRYVELDTDVEHQKRVILRAMVNPDALLEYLSSPQGINKIIVVIILVAAMNAIFIILVLGLFMEWKKRKREAKNSTS